MPIGLYISVPFCKSKCSYCNFASGVFPREQMQAYVDQLVADLAAAPQIAAAAGGALPREVDSIYFGGGTPTLLSSQQLEQVFATIRAHFEVAAQAEITVECAPGTLSDAALTTLLACGVNRVSLGVQSFVDAEARAVGRLHTREVVLADIARLRGAGLEQINVDLIAGLPHQTEPSWGESLTCAIASGAPHVSVYMLEVDEDSRLGRELLAGGTRYHAHFVPDEDLTADLYQRACEELNAAGIAQYEISNFARPGAESRHNLKYWTRQPYLGVGVDAHSLLPAANAAASAVRFAMPETLEGYLGRAKQAPRGGLQVTNVSQREAWEETFFLGLRLNRGVDLENVATEFGRAWRQEAQSLGDALAQEGLAEFFASSLRLTPRGRLLSNEVFERFLGAENAAERSPAAKLAPLSTTIARA